MQFVQDTSMSAQTAAKNGLWALGVRSSVLTKDYVSTLHAAGLRAIVWTPNTPDDWQRAKTAGADFVITDKPIAWATWHAGR
jgi:glycerophosphoryl diester phosphodiesterase